jgi:hypothetical protein
VLSVKINYDEAKLDRLQQKYSPSNIEQGLGNTAFDVADIASEYIKMQLLMQTKQASRLGMSSRIYARKLSKNVAGVYMPKKAIYLDSMAPHYVALKPWRRITSWIDKFRNPIYYKKKGVKGAIYVRPDPFINKAMMKMRTKYKSLIRNSIIKVLK